MPTYDSKLFYGIKLGKKTDPFYARLTELFPLDEDDDTKTDEGAEPRPLIHTITGLTTLIPSGLYLDITYPHLHCGDEEMEIHLNLLDDGERMSMRDMKRFLKECNIIGYAFLLGQLGLDFHKPRFYTHHYIY